MSGLNEALTNLCDCRYPATIEQVREACEDSDVTLCDGTETTLGTILDTIDDPPEEFDSESELRGFVMSLAPAGSVGRQQYDDRNGQLPENSDFVSL